MSDSVVPRRVKLNFANLKALDSSKTSAVIEVRQVLSSKYDIGHVKILYGYAGKNKVVVASLLVSLSATSSFLL